MNKSKHPIREKILAVVAMAALVVTTGFSADVFYGADTQAKAATSKQLGSFGWVTKDNKNGKAAVPGTSVAPYGYTAITYNGVTKAYKNLDDGPWTSEVASLDDMKWLRNAFIENGSMTSGGSWPGSSEYWAWTSDVYSNGYHVVLYSNGVTGNYYDGYYYARFAVSSLTTSAGTPAVQSTTGAANPDTISSVTTANNNHPTVNRGTRTSISSIITGVTGTKQGYDGSKGETNNTGHNAAGSASMAYTVSGDYVEAGGDAVTVPANFAGNSFVLNVKSANSNSNQNITVNVNNPTSFTLTGQNLSVNRGSSTSYKNFIAGISDNNGVAYDTRYINIYNAANQNVTNANLAVPADTATTSYEIKVRPTQTNGAEFGIASNPVTINVVNPTDLAPTQGLTKLERGKTYKLNEIITGAKSYNNTVPMSYQVISQDDTVSRWITKGATRADDTITVPDDTGKNTLSLYAQAIDSTGKVIVGSNTPVTCQIETGAKLQERRENQDSETFHSTEVDGILWHYLYDNEGNINYLYTDNTDLSNIISADGTLLVPGQIDGVKVVGIGGAGSTEGGKDSDGLNKTLHSFIPASVSGFTSIYLPASIRTINDYAFANNTAPAEITIPKTITYIGAGAFQGSKITAVKFSDTSGGLDLGIKAFAECPNLKQLVIRGNNLTMGLFAFKDDTSLGVYEADKDGKPKNALIIPNGTKFMSLDGKNLCSEMGNQNGKQFDGCTSLDTVNIDIPVVWSGMFTNCPKISNVIFGEHVESVKYDWAGTSATGAVSRNTYVLSANTLFSFKNNGGAINSPFGFAGTTKLYGIENANSTANLGSLNTAGGEGSTVVNAFKDKDAADGYQNDYASVLKGTAGAAEAYIVSADEMANSDGLSRLYTSDQSGIEASYNGELLGGKDINDKPIYYSVDKSKMTVYPVYGNNVGDKALDSTEYYVMRSGDYASVTAESYEDAVNKYSALDGVQITDDDVAAGSVMVYAVEVVQKDDGFEVYKGTVVIPCFKYSDERAYANSAKKLSDITAENNTLTEQNKALQKTLDETNTKLTDTENELTDTKRELNNAKIALDEQKASILKLKEAATKMAEDKEAVNANTGDVDLEIINDKIMDLVNDYNEKAKAYNDELEKYNQLDANYTALKTALDNISKGKDPGDTSELPDAIKEIIANADQNTKDITEALRILKDNGIYADTVTDGAKQASKKLTKYQTDQENAIKILNSLSGGTAKDLDTATKDALNKVTSLKKQIAEGSDAITKNAVDRLNALTGGNATDIDSAVDNANQMIAGLQTEIETYKALIANTKEADKDLEDTKAKLAEAEKKLDEIQKVKTDLDEKIKTLTDAQKELDKRNNEITKAAADLEKNNTTEQNLAQTVADAINNAQDALNTIKDDEIAKLNEDSQKAIETAKDELKTANSKILELQNDLFNDSNTIKELNASSEAQKQVIEALNKTIAQMTEDANTISAKAEDATKALETANATIEELQGKIQSLQDYIDALTTLLGLAEGSDKEAVTNAINVLKTQHEEDMKTIAGIQKALNTTETGEKLISRAKDAASRPSNSGNAYSTTNTEIKILQAENARLKKQWLDTKTLSETTENLIRDNKAFNEENKGLDKDNKNLAEENAKYEQTVSDNSSKFTDTITALTKKNTELEKENADLKEKLKNVNTDNGNSASDNDTYELEDLNRLYVKNKTINVMLTNSEKEAVLKCSGNSKAKVIRHTYSLALKKYNAYAKVSTKGYLTMKKMPKNNEVVVQCKMKLNNGKTITAKRYVRMLKSYH